MTIKLCSVDGCGRRRSSKGLCQTHYRQLRETGVTGGPIKFRRPHQSHCDVPGCPKPHRSNGYCEMHLTRVRTSGDPGEVGERLQYSVGCRVVGCGRPHCAKGLCNTHYAQSRKRDVVDGEMTPILDRVDTQARDADGRKQCTTCRNWVVVTGYSKSKSQTDGLSAECRECLADKARLKNYRLPSSAYKAMVEAQEGLCALCRRPPGNKALHVDHNHKCCPVTPTCGTCNRMLLCTSCNLGLGYLQDSPDLLEAAAAYIRGFHHG